MRNIKKVYPSAPPEFLAKQRTKKLVAANKQIALSMSCLSFGLLAIPLGMRSKRKESSLGVAISLGVIIAVLRLHALCRVGGEISRHAPRSPDLGAGDTLAQFAGVYLINRMN